MSFFTALSLSFNNLLTKKGRTILTSFAGSIGIIGIALILSLSNGIQDYIDRVQQETLSSYPINLVDESFDLGSILETVQPAKDNLKKHKLDKIYSRNMITKIMEAMVTEKKSNNLSEFQKFLDSTKKDDESFQYEDILDLNIVGIIRPKADSVSTVMQAGTIGFTNDLTKYIVELPKDERAKIEPYISQMNDKQLVKESSKT